MGGGCSRSGLGATVIPVALIGGLVALAASRAGRKNPGASQAISPTTGILVLKFIVILVGFAVVAISNRLVGVAVEVVLVAFCLPTLLVGPLVIRLGMPRLAYWALRCCIPFHHANNQHAGAMLYATLAATRMRDPATACTWLDERLRKKPVNGVIGQSILGHLAAVRGDRVTAQCVFESIDARPRRPRRLLARVTARDWLVMDAARRGDWLATIRYAERGGNSRWSRAVAGMAQTFSGLGTSLPKWRLRLLWLIAPRRRRLRPLLQRALMASGKQDKAQIAPPGDLPSALGLLAEILTRTAQRPDAVSSAEFLAAVRWVETLLDSAALKAQVEQRVVAFDSTQGPDAAPVLSAFKSGVVELILPVLAANPRLAAGQRGQPLIAEALRRLQGTAFESIEMRAKDFAARAAKKQSLDPLSEWQSWATLCDEANRLLALQPGAQAALFEVLWRPLTNFAVFQHNEMTRHTLSQDIFRWLRAHAHSDRKIVDMLDKNLACYQPKD